MDVTIVRQFHSASKQTIKRYKCSGTKMASFYEENINNTSSAFAYPLKCDDEGAEQVFKRQLGFVASSYSSMPDSCLNEVGARILAANGAVSAENLPFCRCLKYDMYRLCKDLHFSTFCESRFCKAMARLSLSLRESKNTIMLRKYRVVLIFSCWLILEKPLIDHFLSGGTAQGRMQSNATCIDDRLMRVIFTTPSCDLQMGLPLEVFRVFCWSGIDSYVIEVCT
jgi:hypothetical protein